MITRWRSRQATVESQLTVIHQVENVLCRPVRTRHCLDPFIAVINASWSMLRNLLNLLWRCVFHFLLYFNHNQRKNYLIFSGDLDNPKYPLRYSNPYLQTTLNVGVWWMWVCFPHFFCRVLLVSVYWDESMTSVLHETPAARHVVRRVSDHCHTTLAGELKPRRRTSDQMG